MMGETLDVAFLEPVRWSQNLLTNRKEVGAVCAREAQDVFELPVIVLFVSTHCGTRDLQSYNVQEERKSPTLYVSTNTQRMLTGLSTRKASLFLSLRMIITEVSRILQARNHYEQWIRLQNIHHSLRERQAAKPRSAGHDNSRTSRQRASRSHPLWLLIMPARRHPGQILLCGDILRHTLSVVPPDVQEPRFLLRSLPTRGRGLLHYIFAVGVAHMNRCTFLRSVLVTCCISLGLTLLIFQGHRPGPLLYACAKNVFSMLKQEKRGCSSSSA